MTDDVMQDLHGAGNDNAFNIDQVNSLVDNDAPRLCAGVIWRRWWWRVRAPQTSSICGVANKDADGFSQWASADGGDAKVDDIKSDIGHDGNVANATSADAIINQEAFTQNIVMGANIQFNSIDMTTVGRDLTSTTDVADALDDGCDNIIAVTLIGSRGHPTPARPWQGRRGKRNDKSGGDNQKSCCFRRPL